MSVIVGIHQLHYLPWLRYMHKIASADLFIVLDNIQYNKNGHQNRNRIKTPDGPLTLTVPVYDRLGQNLDDVVIDNKRPWARKHWRSMEQHYGKAPFFADHAGWLSEIYGAPWERLNDINKCLLEALIERMGIDTPLVYSSTLDVPGEATERLVNLMTAVGGTTYLSGAHALDTYLDKSAFETAGIDLKIQSWKPPAYDQGTAPFVPELSVVDLLFHCGPESLQVLLGETS